MKKSIGVIILGGLYSLIILLILITKYRTSIKTSDLFDKCLVINLQNTESGTIRWNAFKKKHIFAPYAERFPGIYGKTYNYNYELQNGIIKDKWDFGKWKNNFNSEIVPLSKGEIGCCLSHYYIWKKIVDENIKTCLVLEDDAIKTDPEILNKIKISMKHLPNDWDIFLVGFWNHRGNSDTQINSNIWKVKYFALTHCYIINNRGARKLLNQLPIDMPIDTWLSSKSNKINIYRHNYIKSDSKYPFGNLIMQNLSLKSEIEHTNNWY